MKKNNNPNNILVILFALAVSVMFLVGALAAPASPTETRKAYLLFWLGNNLLSEQQLKDYIYETNSNVTLATKINGVRIPGEISGYCVPNCYSRSCGELDSCGGTCVSCGGTNGCSCLDGQFCNEANSCENCLLDCETITDSSLHVCGVSWIDPCGTTITCNNEGFNCH